MNRWKDWYGQGKRDMDKAKLDIEQGYYEWACFTLHQATEKVVRALALKYGASLWGHSLNEMFNVLGPEIKLPAVINEHAKLLDLYYIPTRYPNGFPAGKPADYFTEKQAKEAADAASAIIGFCESHLST